MKVYNKQLVALLILAMLFALIGCGTPATDSDSPSSSASPCRGGAGRSFIHPGTLNHKAYLDFVKGPIAAGQNPWASAFNELKTLATPNQSTKS